MKMAVHELEQTTRSIAREYENDLVILGVTAADGESDHAELLVEVCACGSDPCMVQINVPRADRQATERVLRDRFRALVQRSRSGGLVGK